MSRLLVLVSADWFKAILEEDRARTGQRAMTGYGLDAVT